MPFLLCADFSIFPDNTQLGPLFTVSAMDFADTPGGGGPASFVNETKGQLGLQFPDSGLEVALPTPVSRVRLHLGQFASPFDVEGVDGSGVVVSKFNMNYPNTYVGASLHGRDLTTVRFLGGRNEGILVSLCIVV
jgi:hypothetical protein